MAGKKQKLVEWDVLEAQELEGASMYTRSDNSTVSRESQHKNCSVKYLDGKMSDAKKSVHVVSFNPTLRHALESSRKNKSSVSFVNCLVNAASHSCWGQPNRIKVEASPRQFVVAESAADDEPTHTTLSGIEDISVNQLITVTVKVMELTVPETLTGKDGKELCKQECRVCVSGCVCLVLWEKDVGRKMLV